MPSHEIADALAECLIAHDWEAAHDLMAPWQAGRWTPAVLEETWNSASNGDAEPAEWHLEISPLEHEDLAEAAGFGPPTEPFPPQLSKKRFREWVCIEFRPGEGADGSGFDCWVATAVAGGDTCVGYLEFASTK
ncbi:MAG TPA: hypothetical protein PLL69_06655 [Gemmatimonadales bacterium]|nr:hypothetical protein [Gemmatimonadales bacterium]